MGQEAGAFQFETETFAQSGAGKTVKRTRRILAIQDERIREQALDGARIDIGLVGDITTFAQPAPVPNQCPPSAPMAQN